MVEGLLDKIDEIADKFGDLVSDVFADIDDIDGISPFLKTLMQALALALILIGIACTIIFICNIFNYLISDIDVFHK